MPMQPEQEAAYAINFGISRANLGTEAARLAYDRLLAARRAGLSPRETAPSTGAHAPGIPARTPPEVRARILQMFKRGNHKYALPFEKDRLAIASFMGGNWEEYGQVVLQMAILDTLLSIEEQLGKIASDAKAPSD